jgi:hypothetical protein
MTKKEEPKFSYHDYAALVFGPDAESTWLWAQVAQAGTMNPDEDFYATVMHGNWQIKVMPSLNAVMVMSTNQLLLNARLAYFGRVPAELAGLYPIHKHLRMTEYAGWPGLVDTGAF